MRRAMLAMVVAVLAEGCDASCGRGYQEDAEGVCWPAVDWEVTGCQTVECFSGELLVTDIWVECEWPCVEYEGQTGRRVVAEFDAGACLTSPIPAIPDITVSDGDCG